MIFVSDHVQCFVFVIHILYASCRKCPFQTDLSRLRICSTYLSYRNDCAARDGKTGSVLGPYHYTMERSDASFQFFSRWTLQWQATVSRPRRSMWRSPPVLDWWSCIRGVLHLCVVGCCNMTTDYLANDEYIRKRDRMRTRRTMTRHKIDAFLPLSVFVGGW